MENKYGEQRLDLACKRALKYGNLTYYAIKQILEKKLENEPDLFEQSHEKKLTEVYARDIKELLKKAAGNGNNGTSKK